MDIIVYICKLIELPQPRFLKLVFNAFFVSSISVSVVDENLLGIFHSFKFWESITPQYTTHLSKNERSSLSHNNSNEIMWQIVYSFSEYPSTKINTFVNMIKYKVYWC